MQHVTARLERPVQSLDAASDIDGPHVGLLGDVLDALKVRRAQSLHLDRAEQVRGIRCDAEIQIDCLTIRDPKDGLNGRVDRVRRSIGDGEDVNH